MKKYVFIPLLSGLLFGAGMVLSGMADPAKVIAFLDVAGEWKIDLAFVMGGALMVFVPFYHFIIKPRGHALDNSVFSLNQLKSIDGKLIAGASLLGLGWGLAGICPGPALASISNFNFGLLGFIVAMMVGMMLVHLIQNKS
ncbi:DUF6691 family protein [Vibrio gangliei]|uniref:DUF6691 family protein n=1 Tax=Vibrio gangliei TaxID=2077090 RepID=UPI000D014FA5|nr:DUF6691 family protein [Vibrio gangliei]